LDRVFEVFPALDKIRHRRGGYLSGGEQQMLTVARALMGNPRLLLLDEPSEGLAPLVVQQLEEQIAKLKQEGMTILLSEQNAEFSLGLSDRVYILEKGEVRFDGTVDDFMKDEETCRAYLTV
jgi:branched-chain amino acid transport system ATP-binding protein